MGRDKAHLSFGGVSFLTRVARALAPHVITVRVVGRSGDEEGLTCIEDSRPGWGPLAGIESALATTTAVAAFVVACDMPLVTTELLGLVARRAARVPDTIVVPVDLEGRVAPLCGVYPRTALATATRLLDSGERRPRALLDAFPSALIPFEEYAHLASAPHLLRNVNTPSEYASLLGED